MDRLLFFGCNSIKVLNIYIFYHYVGNDCIYYQVFSNSVVDTVAFQFYNKLIIYSSLLLL